VRESEMARRINMTTQKWFVAAAIFGAALAKGTLLAGNAKLTHQDYNDQLYHLLLFESACQKAQTSPTAIDMREAIASVQEQAINIGWSKNDKSYSEYLASLTERLVLLQKATKTKVVSDQQFRAHVQSQYNKMVELSVSLETSLDNLSLSGRAASQTKILLDKSISLNNQLGVVQDAEPIEESNENANHRNLCYQSILDSIREKKSDIEKNLKDLNAELLSQNAAAAQQSVMPGPEQVLAYVLSCKDQTDKLKDKWITVWGCNAVNQIQCSIRLKEWLKGLEVVRSKAPYETSNRFELELSDPKSGENKASVIFYLENGKIRLHDIWLNDDVFGRNIRLSDKFYHPPT